MFLADELPCGRIINRTLAVILLLTLASLSPILSSTVPDIDRLQIHAISLFEKWAFPGSSIESMLSILHTTRAKCQILYN